MPFRLLPRRWMPLLRRQARRGDGLTSVWKQALAGLSLTLGLYGCRGTTKTADNPVVGPRPPRVQQILAQLDDPSRLTEDGSSGASAADARAAGGILQVSASVDVIRDEDVAARVNGKPIFVAEVLERYRGAMEAQRSQMPPQAYHQARRELLQKELDGYIEQALVLDAVRKKFKQEQWDELQQRLEEFFYESEIPDLQKRLEVSTLQEVEVKMQQAGTSLAAYRRVWGDRQLAAQWVREQIPDPTASRQELLAEYQQRIADYRTPEQVKWQECWIATVKSGGPEGARKRLEQAIEALRGGATFDQVVAQHSDGPQAKDGGHWDWSNLDSLADDRLREALAALQLNQIGPVLESEKGFRLIKLTGRRAAETKPFEQVQNELRESILQRKREVAAKELIAKLRTEAHIETILGSQAPAF